MCSEDASLCFLYSKAFPCWLVGTWTIDGPAELWGWPTAFCCCFIWSESLSSLTYTDQYSAKDLCEMLWRTLEICLCSFFLSGTLLQKFYLFGLPEFQLPSLQLSRPQGSAWAPIPSLRTGNCHQEVSWSNHTAPLASLFSGPHLCTAYRWMP